MAGVEPAVDFARAGKNCATHTATATFKKIERFPCYRKFGSRAKLAAKQNGGWKPPLRSGGFQPPIYRELN